MANRLRTIREDRGLTQEQLAARMNTTKAQISRLENSRRQLSFKWLHRAAAALECHWTELLDDAPARDEQALLEAYRGLSEDQRPVARKLIDALGDGPPPERRRKVSANGS